MMSPFSLAAFQDLSLSLSSSIIMSDVNFSGFVISGDWIPLGFEDLYISSNLGSCFAIVSLYNLSAPFSPFSRPPIMNILYARWCPKSPRLLSFLILFSFCSFNLIISFVLSTSLLILFSSCSNVLLNSFSEFLVSLLYFSTPYLLCGSLE